MTSQNNLNEKRVYAVVVLSHYAPGCDPLGVDDWCDEYWCPTYAEAIRAKAVVAKSAIAGGEGERGVAAVSVTIMNFGVGRHVRRGVQVILENCRCPQHGGVTSEHEASDLDILYNTGIGWVEAQEADNVRKDRIGLSGPSVTRWMRAKQIYDEVFASESESGSSPEKSHVNAISSVNEMLVAGGVLQDYTDSIQPNSGDADKFYYQGVTFAESGDNHKAIENFTEAIRLQPDHAAAFYNRGLCHNSLGNSQMSYEDLREAVFLRTDYDFDTNTAISSDTDVMICQQCQTELMENAKFCSECGTEVPEPQSPPICQQCRTELMENAKFCFQCGTKVLATQDAIYDRGNSQAELGSHLGAIEDFTEVIRLMPDHVGAFDNRSVIYALLGNHQKAIQDFTELIRLKQGDADTYYNRGISYARLGGHLKAVEDFTHAIRLRPDRADTYYNRGMIRAELGGHVGAVEDFTEVIRQGPVHADMHYNRGVSRAELGNHSSAVEDFTEAIRLQPEHLDAFQKQGISQTEMNKPGVSRLVNRIFPWTKPRD